MDIKKRNMDNWYIPTVSLPCSIMVLILDGNSEIGAQVLSYLGYLICVRYLFSSRAAQFYFQKKNNFRPMCAT